MNPKSQTQQEKRDEQIYQLSTLVAGEFSLPEVLERLAEAAVKIVDVKACSIRLLDEETNDLKMRSSYGLSEEYQSKGVVSRHDPVIKAAFAGEAIVIDDMRLDPRVKYQKEAIKEELVSQLTVVMKFRNQPVGVLRLYSPEPKHFNKADIKLARAVASQCAVAIVNARFYNEAIEGAKMTEQMRLAGLIQRRMIPEDIPQLPGVELAATYIPCFDVGGDLYDFLPLGHHRLAIVIADVIGKGMPAAMMMSWLKGVVRTHTDTFQFALEAPRQEKARDERIAASEAFVRQAVQKFNRMSCRECKIGEFITLFYAIIDSKTKTLTYCSCGHEPTVLLRGGQVRDLDTGGLVLGVDRTTSYEIETLSLEDGDCVLFYTDGLIDAVNFDEELWGRERLLAAAQKGVACSAEHIVKNVLRYRRRFSGLARQIDDTSIIVAKVGDSHDCHCQDQAETGGHYIPIR